MVTVIHLLGLDQQPPTEAVPITGHTAATYRAARRRRKIEGDLQKAAISKALVAAPLMTRELLQDTRENATSLRDGKSSRNLLSTTILEEDDTSEFDLIG